MPPTFDLPDAYSEEIAPSGAPIKGVGTGTVFLTGKFPQGDINKPTRVGTWDDAVTNFGGLVVGSAAYDAWAAFKNKCPAVVIVRVKGTQATKTIVDRQTPTPVNKLKITVLVDGIWANYVASPKAGIQAIITDGAITNTFKLTVKFYYWEKGIQVEYVESWDNLSIVSTAARYFPTIINASSHMITVEDLAPASQTPPGHLPATGTNDMAGGVEPVYTGSGTKEGIDLGELDDDINIVITDKDDSNTRSLQLAHCQTMMDRQTVVNPSIYMTVAEVKAIGDAIDDDRWVLTYPWRVVYDPVMQVARSMRPAGFRAGLMARLDPCLSPCNHQEYMVIGLERQLSRADLVSLQNSRISPTYIWGTRGIRVRNGINGSSNENLSQVYRRRMADYIMESVEDAFGWAVSLPQTEDNRKAVVAGMTNWFRDQQAMQWIEGFFVKDKTDDAAKAARKAIFRYGVKLFGVMDYINLQSEIGPNVIVTTEA